MFLLISGALALYNIKFEEVETRKRSYYCKKMKEMFHGEDEATTFQPGQDNKCDVPSYDKAKDDSMALDTLNFMRWAVGFNNTVTVDDRFHSEQCQYAGYRRGTGYNSGLYYGYNCYDDNLWVAEKSSYFSTQYPNTANLLYHVLMKGIPGGDNTDMNWRPAFLHHNMSKISSCGVGKGIAVKYYGFLDSSAEENPKFITWPHPGPIDMKFVPKSFMFQAAALNGQKNIRVTLNDTEVPFDTSYWWNSRWYDYSFNQYPAWPGVVFGPNLTNLTSNTKITVSIQDSSSIYNYTMYITNCDEDIADDVFDSKFGRVSTGPAGDDEEKAKKKKTAIIVVVVLLVVIIAAVTAFCVWFFFFRKPKDNGYKDADEVISRTTETKTAASGRTITFESRQEEFSKDGNNVTRKTIIIT